MLYKGAKRCNTPMSREGHWWGLSAESVSGFRRLGPLCPGFSGAPRKREGEARLSGKPPVTSVYAEQAAAMIRVSRFRARSARAFAARLGDELGWGSLSRQAVYDWEAGRTRVPAAAILAAAHLADVSVEELFAIANRFRCPGNALGGHPRTLRAE
jgi:hypothetical protein